MKRERKKERERGSEGQREIEGTERNRKDREK